ncbi:MAG: Calcineurin-like phosphoesterase [Actinobacteria bacterium ADurb.Bin346]|nr:MAG: Calcineurin-like phosphoesterase [Actinobacteria bacterium ADurb.Bin346]
MKIIASTFLIPLILSSIFIVGSFNQEKFGESSDNFLSSTGEGSVLFNICVSGDNRPANDSLGQPQTFLNLINYMKKCDPELYFNTGDIINGGSSDEVIAQRQFTDYINAVKNLDCPVFVSCGNHDVANKTTRSLFESMVNKKAYEFAEKNGINIYFPVRNALEGMPGLGLWFAVRDQEQESYYYFKYGGLYFIILYAYQQGKWGAIEGQQLEWLKKILNILKNEKVFIFIHPPVYSFLNPDCITDGSLHVAFSSKENQYDIRNIFSEFKVDAVFSGHEHMYHMEHHGGTTYVISGCSGASPYASEEEGGFLHFVEIKIKENTWIMSVRDIKNNLFYEEEISFN